MSDFGPLLKKLIEQRFPSRRAFLRAINPEKEETDSGYLSKIIAGRRPPPLERLEIWADALGLTGADRDRFIDLGQIAHLSPETQSRFVKLRDDYVKLRDDYAKLLATVREAVRPKRH